MKVLTFLPRGYFGSNTYLIFSDNEAAVIDPSVKYENLKSHITENGLTVKFIIITHAHFDHILEIDDWVQNTNAEVIVGTKDANALSDPYLNCYRPFLNLEKGYNGNYTTVDEGSELKLSSQTLKFLSTPGHSPGSITVFADHNLFVGDVVFNEGGYGRCDLPGGDFKVLFSSIGRILSFDEETMVYSGHGEPTTLKEIKKYRRY